MIKDFDINLKLKEIKKGTLYKEKEIKINYSFAHYLGHLARGQNGMWETGYGPFNTRYSR